MSEWFDELTPEQRKHYRNDLSEVGRWQFDKGAEYAEARIIKLLEDNANHFQIGGGYEGAYDMALGLIKGEEWAIALIKGEQK